MYDNIANIYDLLIKDVDYVSYARFFHQIIRKYSKKPVDIVLDLGCGTGNLTTKMRDLGYSMIGADPSLEMLNIAMQKDSKNIQYINQAMEDLDLFGTITATISLLDCVNHVLDPKILLKGFKRVSLFSEPDSLFIFDVNSEYKFENVYGDKLYYDLSSDLAHVWENYYDRKSKICEMNISYFIEVEDGIYKRLDTQNKERAYSDQEIKDLAKKAGFEYVDTLGDCLMEAPKEDATRIFYIFRKK